MTSSRALEITARWLPPLLAPVVMLAAWAAGPATYQLWVSAHDSVMENLLGGVLLAALGGGLWLFTRPETKRIPNLRPWLVAWCGGVFFFLGEDMNWGQYIFNWTPPDYVLAKNKEGETNLHNMSAWFNQKPRMVVQLWVFVAGVIVALGWMWPRRALARLVPDILWPRRETVLLALVTTLVPAMEWVVRAIWGQDQGGVPIRFSEIQEFFFAWFMLLYAIDLGGRIRPREGQPAAARQTCRMEVMTPAE